MQNEMLLLVVEGEVECIYACSSHVWSAQGVRELAVLQNTRGLTAPESESATSVRAGYHVPFDNEAAATFLVYRNNNNVGGPWHSATRGLSPSVRVQLACLEFAGRPRAKANPPIRAGYRVPFMLEL